DLGICGCTDRDGDAECGGAASGFICSGPAGICVPGCSVAAGRNGCPAGLVCSDQTGGVGICVAGCQNQSDCRTAPFLRCDTNGAPPICVQCLVDGDCTAPLVCDPTSHRCVECTAARNECSPLLAGAACLAGGVCGCA